MSSDIVSSSLTCLTCLLRHHYRASWLGVALLGAISCCNGDTWASELGAVLARKQPFLITTFQSVPRVSHCQQLCPVIIDFSFRARMEV